MFVEAWKRGSVVARGYRNHRLIPNGLQMECAGKNEMLIGISTKTRPNVQIILLFAMTHEKDLKSHQLN